jgi:NADPH-dependent 2,4-dienoyl-CoA reductase/sulfur reductase-like enzyme
MGTEPGMGVACAAPVTQRLSGGPAVIAEGRINHPDIGERALREGACDLVGMTRALIADPRMPQKTAAGELPTIRPCVADNLCIARRIRKFAIACLQNPEVGFEATIAPPRDPQTVVVIGGGVAGLEAARRAAEQGDRVTLFERDAELGGQVRLLAQLPGRGEYRLAVDWRTSENERLGVEVILGHEPSAAEVAERHPDLVVVATGSEPESPAEGVLTPADVLGGDPLPPGAAIVIDEEGHHKGLGLAELLASDGREVTLVPVAGPVGEELVTAFALPLALERLAAAGVRVVEGCSVAEITPGRVVLRRRYDGTTTALEGPLVVHAGRQHARPGMVSALRDVGLVIAVVGDARAPRQVHDAIRDGYEAVSSRPQTVYPITNQGAQTA